MGRGSGNTAAIIGGAMLGALVGGSVGHSMDAADRLYVAQTLEYGPSRQVVAWRNPDSRTRYEVEPLVTYESRDGRYCREYQTKAWIGGELQQVYGTACRQPDGSWEVSR
jgi:surface antigen